MGCGSNIVPGFNESNKIKDPGLQMKIEQELWNIPEQEITSADTSINTRVPAAGHTALSQNNIYKSGEKIIDIGGGKSKNVISMVSRKNKANLKVFDPFNKTSRHNKITSNRFGYGQSNTSTAMNVLNVIKEKANRKKVIEQGYNAISQGQSFYVQIYEGNKSGKGKQTSKGWQENRTLDSYIKEVEAVFGKGNVEIITLKYISKKNDSMPSYYNTEEKRTSSVRIIKATKIKGKRNPHGRYENFSSLESRVRNMPRSYDDWAGAETRKGDAVTEKLIRRLREQEAAGVISSGERYQVLLNEIEKNRNAWESFLKRPKGMMGYGSPMDKYRDAGVSPGDFI